MLGHKLVALPKQMEVVLEVPLCNLRPSIIYSVPCGRILQRPYSAKSCSFPTDIKLSSAYCCRVQMNQYQDPERLTDDKDWTTHVHAREVSERKVDGLCMDTLTRSTKPHRKASIPSVNQFLGASEDVPNVPVDPSQTSSDDKQRDKTQGPETQASAGLNQDTSHYVVTPAERKSPEVVRSSEYTWESLLCQPSDVRSKRSQSFNWDDPENQRPGKTRSLTLASDKQGEVKRPVRSKSLRGYTHRELAISSAVETAPFDKTLISVKRGDENAKRNKLKNPKTQKTGIRPGNMTQAEGSAKNKQINRSGSAPSVRAKEKLAKTKLEGSLNRRHSSRWIPDPDYQTVSMEELVSAAQQVKTTRNGSVVVVEIHNVPRDRDPKVTTLVGTATSQVVDAATSTSIQQPTRSHEDQTNCSTTVDVKSLPIPGVARRVPTVLPNDPDKNEETNISIKDTHERRLSVKNRTQNLETQVVDVQPNTRHSHANYKVTEARLTIDVNNNSQTLPSWREKQTAREATKDPNIESSQIGQPSLKAKPKVGSIGKLTLVKHVETPVRGGNPEITPKNHPTKSFENASSTQIRQQTDVSSPRNATLLLRNSDEQRENITSHVPVCAPPPASHFVVDSRSSRQGQDNEAKITITPRDSQDVISVLTSRENKPTVKDTDTNLTLEERKKTWKREQILDQLHSAHARNGSQNYIFGTGMAYQSCMPELQNKLKQLTLAK